MRTHLPILLALALGLGLAGCTRKPHTRSTWGTEVHSAFDRQAQATGSGSAQGLDSEEAAAIQRRYRQSIGNPPAKTSDPRSSVLILEDDHATPKKQ
ncbi:MAG: hypothetical protein JNL83_25355 [Myxococcales bacterium]|nr:hypothetical protein [Myxococcales bacterium]